MTAKNPTGRPRAISSPDEMDRLVDSYIDLCRTNEEPLTLIGMILALGLNSKQSFYEYENYAGFSDSVKRARSIIEAEYEKRLVQGGGAGAIFALKNFGWKDKQEVEHTVDESIANRILAARKRSGG